MIRNMVLAIPRVLYSSVQMNFRFYLVSIVWIMVVRLRKPLEDVLRSMIS